MIHASTHRSTRCWDPCSKKPRPKLSQYLNLHKWVSLFEYSSMAFIHSWLRTARWLEDDHNKSIAFNFLYFTVCCSCSKLCLFITLGFEDSNDLIGDNGCNRHRSLLSSRVGGKEKASGKGRWNDKVVRFKCLAIIVPCGWKGKNHCKRQKLLIKSFFIQIGIEIKWWQMSENTSHMNEKCV